LRRVIGIGTGVKASYNRVFKLDKYEGST